LCFPNHKLQRQRQLFEFFRAVARALLSANSVTSLPEIKLTQTGKEKLK
jgi:hypothetical protein